MAVWNDPAIYQPKALSESEDPSAKDTETENKELWVPDLSFYNKTNQSQPVIQELNRQTVGFSEI